MGESPQEAINRVLAASPPREVVASGNGSADYETVLPLREDPAQFRPTELVCGVHTMVIEWLSNTAWRNRELIEEAKGHHDWERGTITMRLTGCSEQLLRETLLHEVMHAVIAMSGLQKHWPSGTSEDPEEVLVEFSSVALLQVMQANPALVSYLMDSSV